MLLTLLLWFYCTVVTFLAGDALLQLGRRLTGPISPPAAPFVCLLGAAAITAMLGWAWLFIPINLLTHTGLVAALTGYALWQRPRPILALPRWRYQWPGWLTISLLFSVVWLRSVQLPRLIDTGGYHAPMIEWIHQYAIVPGLANLNYRFGFNNAWFLLNALFRFQLTPAIPWHGLNGWIMVMLGWFSLTEWHRRQLIFRPSFSTWLGGWVAIGLLVIFHWTLSSPSPDLPTHVYVVLCFWAWFRRAEPDQRRYRMSWDWFIVIFGLSALTTKLSAVTLLLLPTLVLWQMLLRKDWRGVFIIGGTGVFFTGYWLIGNVLLSGYIAYPSLNPLVDWFGVDWKVPPAVIATGLKNLQQGTRGDTGATFSLAWLPYWFQTRPALEQGIFVSLLAAPVPMLWRRQAFVGIPGYSVALIVAWIGVGIWFLLAPEIRFGAGSILIAIGLCYGPVLNGVQRWPMRIQPVAVGLTLTGLTGLVLVLAAFRREPVGWFLPAGYPDSALRRYKVGTHPVFYPTDDNRLINGIRGYWGDCYDADLPCSPYPMPDLRWRGQTLDNGFRTEQPTRH